MPSLSPSALSWARHALTRACGRMGTTLQLGQRVGDRRPAEAEPPSTRHMAPSRGCGSPVPPELQSLLGPLGHLSWSGLRTQWPPDASHLAHCLPPAPPGGSPGLPSSVPSPRLSPEPRLPGPQPPPAPLSTEEGPLLGTVSTGATWAPATAGPCFSHERGWGRSWGQRSSEHGDTDHHPGPADSCAGCTLHKALG